MTCRYSDAQRRCELMPSGVTSHWSLRKISVSITRQLTEDITPGETDVIPKYRSRIGAFSTGRPWP
ncbi:hypothetical protein [Xenorhabdus nematophila]|nr:hypothetical protein [Xenorhabdus nematophila]